MSFIFTGAFWGIFLVLIGVSILVRIFFNIDFPVFRLFFGLFFIGIGISIIFGRQMSFSDSRNAVFGDSTFQVDQPGGKYSVVFGRGVTDLTNPALYKDGARVEVVTVFGENTIYIKKDSPVRINAVSAFGQIELPDGNNITFGNSQYSTGTIDKKNLYLKLEINTVFGATRVLVKE